MPHSMVELDAQAEVVDAGSGPVAKASSALPLLRCGVGGEVYGLGLNWVHSIQRSDRLRDEPGADGRVGRFPRRGGDVDVFSLAERLSLPHQPSHDNKPIILVNGPPERWGLLVDWVSSSVEIQAETLLPLPSLVRDPVRWYFEGAVVHGDELIPVLAPEGLHPQGPPPRSGPVEDGRDWLPAYAGGVPKGAGQLLLFGLTERAAGRRPIMLALSITQVREICDLPRVVRVPGAPPGVRGLIQWRGHPLPVVDVHARLGLPPLTTDRPRVVVVYEPGLSGPAGLLIHSDVRVLRLPAPHQVSDRPLPRLDLALVRAVVELKNETAIVPDLKPMLRLR